MAVMDQLHRQYIRRVGSHADRGGGRSRGDWRVVVWSVGAEMCGDHSVTSLRTVRYLMKSKWERLIRAVLASNPVPQ
jgi:hypothetical protein